MAVGILVAQDSGPLEMHRWFLEDGDARSDAKIGAEIASYLGEPGVRSIAITDGIIGCPHEEGIDYPLGEACPRCPFWAGRDRWAGS